VVDQLDAVQVTKLKSKVTYVAALINILLSAIKIGFGIIGQSAALIADGIHSLSDLFSDVFVLIAVKLGSREADADHQYGHRRYETLTTVLLGIGLIVIAGGIAVDVIERILEPEHLFVPEKETLAVAAISILANEWLYHYTKRVAKKTRSKLLLANAWHHRSDAISSIVVLFGIAAVLLGYPYADAIAAVIVALMVAKIGLSLILDSIRELVDTSLPVKAVGEIREAILETDGVEGIHLLRTRKMGEDTLIDAHIVVDPRITVSEGHMIGDKVRDHLIDEFEDVMDVLVHIDPEDDENKHQQRRFLTRQEVTAYLQRNLGELSRFIEDIKIHYLDDSVELEVIVAQNTIKQQEQLEQIKRKCASVAKEVDMITKIQVLNKV
jgi:cation diffusion facilitator family transporter